MCGAQGLHRTCRIATLVVDPGQLEIVGRVARRARPGALQQRLCGGRIAAAQCERGQHMIHLGARVRIESDARRAAEVLRKQGETVYEIGSIEAASGEPFAVVG